MFQQPAVLLPHHQAGLERDHRRLRDGGLLPAQLRHAPADGGLPAEVEERPLLRPAAVRRIFPDVPCSQQLRALDRGPGGRRDHGRLRRRQLLPREPRDPPADGGLPLEDQARLELRASRLQRRLRRRAVPIDSSPTGSSSSRPKASRAAAAAATTAPPRPSGVIRWRRSCTTRSSSRRTMKDFDRHSPRSSRRRPPRARDHLHRHHDRRLRRRLAPPGDPRRERESPAPTRSTSTSSAAASIRSRRRLPFRTITDAVTINGYSQPGASANTNAPNQGSNAVIRHRDRRTQPRLRPERLDPRPRPSTIRGLAINRA